MKKYVWLAVTLLLMVSLLTACGGPAAPPAEQPPAPPPAEESPPPPPPTPPAIPHSLEGRADCLICHETGVGEAPVIPADHAGRTSDICTTCHQPAA